MSEQQMTALVERVGEALQPDVGRLVSAGAARGRARRRRRVAGSALLGVAVVGAVALAGVLLPGSGGDAGPDVTDPDVADPVAPHRVVAVAPTEMDVALAALLPGASVPVHDDVPYEYQRQHGTVRWRGVAVTLRIDSRSAGIAKSARERCEAVYEQTCEPGPGGAWLFEGGRSDGRTDVFDDYEVAYLPEGYVIEATAGPGAMSRARLRQLVLADVWLR